MEKFWNERFRKEEFVYGIKPNSFFKRYLSTRKPGRLLLPAEGEGRNAVYAASNGWEVDAFDFSTAARDKALRLAEESKVKINYFNSRLEKVDLAEQQYDCIGLIFAHMPSGIRRNVHQQLIRHLKPGGMVIMEAFNKNQIERNTGGPKNTDMLYSISEIEQDFEPLGTKLIEETTQHLSEGSYHNGKADLIHYVGFLKQQD